MCRKYFDVLSKADGKLNSLCQEKIKLLLAINFDFGMEIPSVVIEDLGKLPTAWVSKFEELKLHLETCGSFKINSDGTSIDALSKFVEEQRSMFTEYCNNLHKSEEIDPQVQLKIKKLEAICFDFGKEASDNKVEKISKKTVIHQAWRNNYEILKSHFKEHGTLEGIDTDGKNKTLSHFMKIQRRMYKQKYIDKLDENGVQVDHVTKEKIQLLKEVHFDFSSKIIDEEWETMFEQLKKFKEEVGSFVVTKAYRSVPENNKLYKWIATQRMHYVALKNGKRSPLTSSRMLKLTDLGFNFVAQAKPRTWEELFEQLCEYKKAHSHVNVPETDPILGGFVHAARYNYSKFMKGEKAYINEYKIKQLTELGFVFQPGKRVNFDRSKFKSWDERFKELIEYKKRYGHTRVPQHFHDNKVLGAWVKKQRTQYKLMKDGKVYKNAMTEERALKLSEIGFEFRLRERRSKGKEPKKGENGGSSDSEI
eukprot:CAMPEP_0113316728 /NCGR_PEP_ID=MMETSP0010_2-20120614/11897_1 /TAXON_ID=216773 ORGANISM="Corethron hystrix, Strain 308" /NCGR_SAMPLE_ID=MMETSP0010_2 /ASSEMBLY_ACC=CAM_ASM_000155 /LENGTH=478 /DNA_ID=CAMNT_0000173521 /DNA_START=143 /DNA_END=1579 /DNA_ORIENTATION=- /assembly_acc=CAM_ASM_000155